MLNTSKKAARMLATLLMRHGVTEAVVSPGSRNAPLIVALERCAGISTHIVVDERSAAFIALGMSAARGNAPVALVCTSGTAPLNYGPALAEAFYRHIPLIAVTADRPPEWIDQDDSQTIVQPGIYTNYIKGTFDIPVESDEPDRMWCINRTLNDAMNLAVAGIPGPVHINIRLADPLGAVEEVPEDDPYGEAARVIHCPAECAATTDPAFISELADTLKTPARVLILAGFMAPSGLDGVLRSLSRAANVIVMHEAQSNLHGHGDFIPNIDATLSMASEDELAAVAPDIVITLGGSLTSRMVKAWLRGLPAVCHWSIGNHGNAVDCFRHLTYRIPGSPQSVLDSLADIIGAADTTTASDTSFKKFWHDKSRMAMRHAGEFAADAPWSDFKAMDTVWRLMPHGTNVQLSNGTAVRYAQLFDYSGAARIDCNRGVSGIDGCTSTAIGMAAASDVPTLLITGDMSMQYDMGALATTFIPASFRIIVLSNGGGGIFRFIKSTRNLDELEKCFVARLQLPLDKLAPAYGFRYLSATDNDSLTRAIEQLVAPADTPAILEIKTDGTLSADVLTQFFNKR